MIKYIFLFIFLLSVSAAKAQYEIILNDPDVIWAAELDLTFWIEPEYTRPDSVFAISNTSTFLKLSNTVANPFDNSEVLLASRLLSLLTDHTNQVFAQPDGIRPLTSTERDQRMYLKDTITTVDPETYMESNQVVYNCWSPESIQLMRVRQLLFYRSKSDEFEVYTLAFAPILKRNYGSTLSESSYLFVPFWFKMPPYRRKDAKKSLLKDPDIIWARRMRTGANMPDLNKLQPFKDFKHPIMQEYVNRLREDPDFKVREGLNWNVMSQDNLKEHLAVRDTVVTFDPDTYEEKIVVIDNSIDGQDIMRLRLMEDWYWDERRRYPVFQLYAFAPMKEKRDNDGNLMFYVPIFWRLARD